MIPILYKSGHINIFGQPLIYPYFILIYSLLLGILLVYILHRRLKYEEIK